MVCVLFYVRRVCDGKCAFRVVQEEKDKTDVVWCVCGRSPCQRDIHTQAASSHKAQEDGKGQEQKTMW